MYLNAAVLTGFFVGAILSFPSSRITCCLSSLLHNLTQKAMILTLSQNV